jgi:exodeoxyribonuclease V alpha subunit
MPKTTDAPSLFQHLDASERAELPPEIEAMADTDPPHAQGEVSKVNFHAEDSGFTVFRIEGYKNAISGTAFGIKEGMRIKVWGKIVQNPRFGEQMKMERHEEVMPTTTDGILSYLSSGLIKGIGPDLATRLVRTYGDKVFDILDEDPQQLLSVRGIKKKKLDQILESWRDQKQTKEIMMFLQGLGVTGIMAVKIMKVYGADTRKVIEENPYQPIEDIWGMGFHTADAMALRLGIPIDSQFRIRAGILHAMKMQTNNGHVFLTEHQLLRSAADLLKCNSSLVQETIQGLVKEGRIVSEYEGERYFLNKMHTFEVGGFRALESLLTRRRYVSDDEKARILEQVSQREEHYGVTLSDEQRQAIVLSVTSGVSIITGGPGTGKTTVSKILLDIFSSRNKKILLAAPTGRAAKRMSEVTGRPANTIHRLLEYNPMKHGFNRNADNPLEADVILVDEFSMVDCELFFSLAQAIPTIAQLVIVGDKDQLPSVGAGNILQDMIESNRVPTVKLKSIFRQAAGSAIITNSHKINEGINPTFYRYQPQTARDMVFIAETNPEKLAQKIVDLFVHEVPRDFNITHDQIQVLSPMKKGDVGTQNLNAMIQKELNPVGGEMRFPERIYRETDRVIQIRNNYDREVFNGDIGTVLSASSDSCTMTFDDRQQLYQRDEMDEVMLAYALTVHKSQGSEYPVVILPVHKSFSIMLQRNLLYTAVTRAKRLLIVVGDTEAVAQCVRNNKTRMRNSGLRERLEESTSLRDNACQ